MTAYQSEALTEKLKEERILHGPEVCDGCNAGDHEQPGADWCECPCHASSAGLPSAA
jgi:hypothetical protein